MIWMCCRVFLNDESLFMSFLYDINVYLQQYNIIIIVVVDL